VQPPPPAGDGGGGSSGGGSPPRIGGSMEAYRFDSSALERAAAAAKELERSSTMPFSRQFSALSVKSRARDYVSERIWRLGHAPRGDPRFSRAMTQLSAKNSLIDLANGDFCGMPRTQIFVNYIAWSMTIRCIIQSLLDTRYSLLEIFFCK